MFILAKKIKFCNLEKIIEKLIFRIDELEN